MDVPLKILKASIINAEKKEINCYVEWEENVQEDIKPLSTWISSNILRQRSPQILIDYLLNSIKFPS